MNSESPRFLEELTRVPRVAYFSMEFAIRDDLNTEAQRVLAVLDPLTVELSNLPEGETVWLDADYWPHDVPREGTRPLPLTRHRPRLHLCRAQR